ncbi:5e5476dc-20fa-48ec-8a40-f0f3db0324bb [Sclerotinia trifoliorum]|uniref:peptidylprolyl isomerase n=1 Tax=Sclerotinia trifoliorum TaxID=28548 RepID=A0A8H2W3D7_9HELO|nr:5e5476dc-20fa-48ec-8a40-f0f3db0324bb [Sclerotinia trifoliorum]
MSYLISRLRISTPKIPIHPKFQYRNFSRTNIIMGVTKTILKQGFGEKPKAGDTVTIEYTGWLKNTNASTPETQKGNQFDSSVGRGAFVVQIGVGKVIKGWDEGVTQMQVGEKATLDITPDFAYGARGFPPVIPANSTLLFDVELQKIS